MSITVRHAVLTATGAAVLAAPMSVLAQEDPGSVLNTLRECSKIDDPTARFACYDNNIRNTDATVELPVLGQSDDPQRGSAPADRGGAAGSMQETRAPQQPASPAGALARSTMTVAAVAERGPGAYLVTLEDGAQWEFAQDMGFSYRAPRRGSMVEIERGALGSHRMRFDGQQPVRIRRVQ